MTCGIYLQAFCIVSMGKKLKEDTTMCENKEFAMDKQELADDMLEQVAGGTAPVWAAGYNIGDVVDLTSLTVNGCCRKNRCQAKPVLATVESFSGSAHTIRLKANCCGYYYHLNLDTHSLE